MVFSTKTNAQIDPLRRESFFDPCRLRGSETLGQPLGSLTVAPGNGLSKVPVHQMQYWYALGVAALVGLVGYVCCALLELQPNQFKIVFLAVFVAIAISVKCLLLFQFRGSRKVDIHENGVQLNDIRDSIGSKRSFLWTDCDPQHNRVMVQPASQIVNGSMLRFRFLFRLNNFEIAQPAHELCLLVSRNELALANYVADMLQCRRDEWAGYVLY